MEVLLTGSVAYDYLMTFPGYFRDHILPDRLDSISLSFLVDSMRRQRGGIAANIAYTLALLGGRPRLWASVGEDFEEYRVWLESKGVDTSGAKVIPGVFTASFFVNTDRSNAQIASFYPGAMAFAAQLSLRDAAAPRPDLTLISPNDPQAMIQYVGECRELGFSYIYDPSQQIVRLTGEDLRQGIQAAWGLFVNDYEFALIEKMTGWDAAVIGAENPEIVIVVTLGEKGAEIYHRGEKMLVPVVPPQHIADPTGVGDAFRGGFLTGVRLGYDLKTCGQIGALAATYCLEHDGPQNHDFTRQAFLERFRQAFPDGEQLEALAD
jgi:adenosine kinase